MSGLSLEKFDIPEILFALFDGVEDDVGVLNFSEIFEISSEVR